MGDNKIPNGMKWCAQCETARPDEMFWQPRNKRLKVVICDQCARANMARWARTQNVGRKYDPRQSVEDNW